MQTFLGKVIHVQFWNQSLNFLNPVHAAAFISHRTPTLNLHYCQSWASDRMTNYCDYINFFFATANWAGKMLLSHMVQWTFRMYYQTISFILFSIKLAPTINPQKCPSKFTWHVWLRFTYMNELTTLTWIETTHCIFMVLFLFSILES